MKRYINHTADAGLEIKCEAIEEAMYEAAMGLIELVYDNSNVASKVTKNISVTSPDTDILLHDWLAEILQNIVYEKFLISKIENIKISQEKHKWKIDAIISGENFSKTKHRYKSDVKAITYHQLKLRHENGKWTGRVIFDL